MGNEMIATMLFIMLGMVLVGVIVSGIMLLWEFKKFIELNRKYKEFESEETRKKNAEEKLNYFIPVN